MYMSHRMCSTTLCINVRIFHAARNKLCERCIYVLCAKDEHKKWKSNCLIKISMRLPGSMKRPLERQTYTYIYSSTFPYRLYIFIVRRDCRTGITKECVRFNFSQRISYIYCSETSIMRTIGSKEKNSQGETSKLRKLFSVSLQSVTIND